MAGVALALGLTVCQAAAPLPENLALRANATANSEHNAHYRARFALDGVVPAAGGQSDLDQAWCVRGDTHRNGAELTLRWSNTVTVAEVVYYGRTAWFAEECWKDFELWAGSHETPVARGQLKQGHGPQHIRLSAPVATRELRFRFLSSYGGLNPGASEIKVFAQPLPPGALGAFHELPPGRPPEMWEDAGEDAGELPGWLAAGKLGFDRLLMVRRQELNPSHVYTYHVEGFQPGAAIAILDLRKTGGERVRELFTSSEGQILDCDLSYDGREILFSWRPRRDEGYHVYLMGVDGSNPRPLTRGPHHDYNACWLPDGGIAFLSTRSSRFAYCWISPVGILYRMERDGSRVRRLSANIVNDFTPSVMEDGRILYSRWEYVDKPAIPIQSLWTIHPDGTGLAGYFGNRVLSPATFMEARSIPGTGRVLCTLTSHNGPCRGAVGLIDIAHGNNAQAGIRNLTPEVAIGQVDKGDGNNIRGPYENPFPIDDQFYLVSRRGTVLARSYDGAQQARLISRRGPFGYYSPQPLRPRPRPPVLAAQVAAAQAAERPPENDEVPVDDETGATVEWATVVLQDVYRGLEPIVQRGEVREIMVVEEMRKAVRTDVAQRAFGFQFPVISCGATYAGKKVWGTAPVAPDGSACFQVPARRPIYFMALDAHGRAVQRMRTFTHLMPGETQGCVGCHEPRQQVVAAPRVAARAPDVLRPPEWGAAVGFDYTRVVQPVLDRHCVGCHSGPTAPRRVDLSGDKTDFFSMSYETLARGRKRAGEAEWDSPYVNWIPTYNGMEQNILEVTPKAWGSPRSRLAEIVIANHPDPEGRPRVDLDPAEQRRLLTWIDLNVPYYGTSETAYPEKPGCRQLLPADLDKVLADVGRRRCAECHKDGKVPRPFWTRIVNPQWNPFLLAPLAREAGGRQDCGRAVFTSTNDADYQAILRTFEPLAAQMAARPRMDMPGAKPAAVDRSCLGKLD